MFIALNIPGRYNNGHTEPRTWIFVEGGFPMFFDVDGHDSKILPHRHVIHYCSVWNRKKGLNIKTTMHQIGLNIKTTMYPLAAVEIHFFSLFEKLIYFAPEQYDYEKKEPISIKILRLEKVSNFMQSMNRLKIAK